MYSLVRPAVFNMDPESAHHLFLRGLEVAGSNPATRALVRLGFAPVLQRPVHAFGLRFPNAVGLAAGWDKDARAWRGLMAAGFGHVEAGTVTPKPQDGNARPRVFRLVPDEAIVNRMGFPSQGMEAFAGRVGRKRPYGGILGVNIGKNKATPNEDAWMDYVTLVRRLGPQADYLAVNISSPNTPGLRELQTRAYLDQLIGAVLDARDDVARARGSHLPVLVKLAPDLDSDGLDDALTVALDRGLDGLIATNTTLSREGLVDPNKGEKGGMSGLPLAARSREFTAQVVQRTGGKLPVISVGGIDSPDEAWRRIDLGACMIQLWSGLIYKGPGLVRDCVEHLAVNH